MNVLDSAKEFLIRLRKKYGDVLGLPARLKSGRSRSEVVIKQQPVEPTPPTTPSPEPKPIARPGHGYTGLIVNCKGLGLKSAMSPVIKNADGEPIYGHKNINPDFVVAYGMVSYADDINGKDTARAGNNPLVVMAVSLADHNSNPVISAKDADRVLDENQSTGFLDKCLVVLLW